MKLRQKRGEKIKEFELINNELFIKEKSLLNSKEWSVNIENIAHHKTIETYSKKGVNIIGMVFILIPILSWIGLYIEGNPNGEKDGIIWAGIFMLIIGIITLKAPMNNTLTINTTHGNLIFYLDYPSKKEVEEFSSILIEKSKKVLVEKYSRVDFDIPEETFIEQINWLLNNNLIDINLYNEKKNEYKINRLIK
ncbi:hypothetical protein PG913_08465 [Tenacibaculum pacificus]|uniref:hypothetical protein n=1 Tax=Tenacibaculum TaxID=104267 RepID=UPI0022F3B09C|nr:hypothetical protein [Tenacibaculum pacificus]WBX72935.1 hypothetical protein PG913_08465 [Tenacibaculum pacificus]